MRPRVPVRRKTDRERPKTIVRAHLGPIVQDVKFRVRVRQRLHRVQERRRTGRVHGPMKTRVRVRQRTVSQLHGPAEWKTVQHRLRTGERNLGTEESNLRTEEHSLRTGRFRAQAIALSRHQSSSASRHRNSSVNRRRSSSVPT